MKMVVIFKKSTNILKCREKSLHFRLDSAGTKVREPFH